MACYTMDEVKIVGAYTIDKILDLSMEISVNSHGKLTYSGIISEDLARKYIQQDADSQVIKVSLLDDLEFCGYPQVIVTEHRDGNCYLHVTLVTSTQLLDIDVCNRFFQDVSQTYENIINEAFTDSGQGGIIAIRGKTKIKKPILQYRETDWNFILRMASRLGTIIVPNVISPEPQITLGVPKRSIKNENNKTSYSINRNPDEYRRKTLVDEYYGKRFGHHYAEKRKGYTLIDCLGYKNFLCYRMKSEHRYKLGDSVNIDGKVLTVTQKRLKYTQGQLQEVYILGHEQEFAVPFHHNSNIAGLELVGTVCECSGKELQLLLDIDAKRKRYRKTWFSYSPPTNNGMYSMPLENEKVMLQWQSEFDHEALVVRPDRKNGSGMPPPQRHFLTEHDNHLMMVSGKVEYTNPVGSMKWLASNGFDVTTVKNVDINAGKDVHVTSQAQIQVFSPERITACKSGVESSIDMISNELHIKAVKKVKARSNANQYKKTKLPERLPSFSTTVSTASKLAAAIPQVLNAKK